LAFWARPDARLKAGATKTIESQNYRSRVKIILWALFLALAWIAALILIARTVGLHSTPGMWAGAIGLPGVVISNWTESQLFHEYHRPLGYTDVPHQLGILLHRPARNSFPQARATELACSSRITCPAMTHLPADFEALRFQIFSREDSG
jgi:hypothetical protein